MNKTRAMDDIEVSEYLASKFYDTAAGDLLLLQEGPESHLISGHDEVSPVYLAVLENTVIKNLRSLLAILIWLVHDPDLHGKTLSIWRHFDGDIVVLSLEVLSDVNLTTGSWS